MKLAIILTLISVLLLPILVDCRSNKIRDDWQSISSSEELTRPDYCTLNPVAGPCKLLLYRYYYNPARQACERFAYGGCKGNKNNFLTKRACLKTCQN
ncbi:hypothetical protein ACKWTF_006877 [Chironomus riparius]